MMRGLVQHACDTRARENQRISGAVARATHEVVESMEEMSSQGATAVIQSAVEAFDHAAYVELLLISQRFRIEQQTAREHGGPDLDLPTAGAGESKVQQPGANPHQLPRPQCHRQ